MSMQISPLRPDFAARVTNIGPVGETGDAAFTALRVALDHHGVLVLPDQPMDDAGQIAFSARWGPMEPTKRIEQLRNEPGAVPRSQGVA